MPTSTYDLIASNVLSSNAASVTFSSLPSSYRDLVLVMNLFGNGGAIRVNGDTGTNYNRVFLRGTGSTASSGTNSNDSYFYVNEFPGTNGGIYIVQFQDYSATDKHKSILARENVTNEGVRASAGRWANTAVINSITIDNLGTSSGSTFYLYGIVS